MNQTFEEYLEDHLEHFGVRGQKWGVRRAGRGGVSNSEFKKKRQASKTKYTKKPAQLTDKQLQDRIKRLQMEKQYKDLNSAKQTQGKKFAEDIVLGAAKGIAVTALTGVGMLAVRNALKKKGITI